MPKERDGEETQLDGVPTDLDVPPLADDDGEATRIDPKPAVKRAALEEEDDEATKFTGPPKKARETKRVLEESRRMNERGVPAEPMKRVHPLVALGVAFVILAALLWAISWMMTPTPPR